VSAAEPPPNIIAGRLSTWRARLGSDFYTRLHPDKTKQRALDQLRKMGYDVTLGPLEAAG